MMMVCSLARIRLMIAMAPTHDQDGDCQVRGYACNLIYNYPHGVLTEAAADGEAGEVGEVGGLERDEGANLWSRFGSWLAILV